MTEFIKITEQNGQKAVSARELHQFLESKQHFADWIQSRIKDYGFVENQDFEVLLKNEQNSNGGRPLKEYAISIDMAKELSMVERNEKGKLASLYFIEMEKKAKEPKQKLLPVGVRNQQQIELIELIRSHLLKGDVVDVAQRNGFSRNTCENVMRNRCFHPHIVKALYDRALFNKQGYFRTPISSADRLLYLWVLHLFAPHRTYSPSLKVENAYPKKGH